MGTTELVIYVALLIIFKKALCLNNYATPSSLSVTVLCEFNTNWAPKKKHGLISWSPCPQIGSHKRWPWIVCVCVCVYVGSFWAYLWGRKWLQQYMRRGNRSHSSRQPEQTHTSTVLWKGLIRDTEGGLINMPQIQPPPKRAIHYICAHRLCPR